MRWLDQIVRNPSQIPKPLGLTNQFNGQLTVPLVQVDANGAVLYGPAARDYLAMERHANSVGVALGVSSAGDGYRTLARQETSWRIRYRRTNTPDSRPAPVLPSGLIRPKRCRGWWWGKISGMADSACPGSSNHGWGLAVDIYNAGGAKLAWLEDWAQQYGFMWENSTEAWHLTYVMGDVLPPYLRLPPPPVPDPPVPDPPTSIEIMFTGYVRFHTDAAVFAAFSDGSKKFLRDEATFNGDKALRLLSGTPAEKLGVTTMYDPALFAACGLVPAESRDSLFFLDRVPRDAWGVPLG